MINITFEDIGFVLYSLENFEDKNLAKDVLNLSISGPKFSAPKKCG
jgi:hypothetical protein